MISNTEIFWKIDLKLSTTDRDISFYFKSFEGNNNLLGTIAVYIDDVLESGNK